MIEKGTRVRIKDSEIDGFVRSFADKARGRVGIVTGLAIPCGTPFVTFPAIGRKKEFKAGRIREPWLEVVDEATPAAE